MDVAVYVPCGQLAQVIDPGSGVVGTPVARDPARVLIDYESNRYGAVNIVTFADRVGHAWGRHSTGYATVARRYVEARDLVQVGWFDPERGEVWVDEFGDDQATLALWLGVDDLDEAELVCTARVEA